MFSGVEVLVLVLVVGAIVVFVMRSRQPGASAPPGSRGLQDVAVQFNSVLPIDETRSRTLSSLVGSFNRAGFHIVSQTQDLIAFRRTSRSALVWLFTIILFPIGLLIFFTRKREESVTVLLTEAGGATTVKVTGCARPVVVKQLRELADVAA